MNKFKFGFKLFAFLIASATLGSFQNAVAIPASSCTGYYETSSCYYYMWQLGQRLSTAPNAQTWLLACYPSSSNGCSSGGDGSASYTRCWQAYVTTSGCSPIAGEPNTTGVCFFRPGGMTSSNVSTNPQPFTNPYQYGAYATNSLNLTENGPGKCVIRNGTNCSVSNIGKTYDTCFYGGSPYAGAYGTNTSCTCQHSTSCAGGYAGAPCWSQNAGACPISGQTVNSSGVCSCPSSGPPLNAAGTACACDIPSGMIGVNWTAGSCVGVPPPTPAPCAPSQCFATGTVATASAPVQCQYRCLSAGGGSGSLPGVSNPAGPNGADNFSITAGKCSDAGNMSASGKTCSSGTLTAYACFFTAGQCPGACPSGSTGTLPNCTCTDPTQTYNPTTNVCESATGPTCGTNQNGTPPNCCTNPAQWNATTSSCMSCPLGSTGTYPACTCSGGSYNSTTNACECASGSTGTYPNCCVSPSVWSVTNNQCMSCPPNSTGTYGSCVCSTGTYNPTTNSCESSTNACPFEGEYPNNCCNQGASFINGVCEDGITINPNTSAGNCPPNHYVSEIVAGVEVCRPKLPSAEFYYPSSGTHTLYPACGTDRIAVKRGTLEVLNGSSSTVPNAKSDRITTGSPAITLSYATGSNTNDFRYLFDDYKHCACIGTTVTENAVYGATNQNPAPLSSMVGSSPRIYPDTFDVISSKTTSNNVKYGMVAIKRNGTGDGRLASFYNLDINADADASSCRCPNLNEIAVGASNSVSSPRGPLCEPAFNDSRSILATYDPLAHDAPNFTQILNRASEPKDPTTGKVTANIFLPTSSTVDSLQQYKRKIWACLPPYHLDINTQKCVFDRARHGCGLSNLSVGIPASEVAASVTGVDGDARFNHVMNKKLACCLNRFGADSSYEKFDCIDNSRSSYSNFDALWASKDSDSPNSEQLNALILTNSAGKPITGFYTLNGVRCEEFSEFGGTLRSYKINPTLNGAVQMNRVNGDSMIAGPVINLPTGNAYNTLKTYYNSKSIKTPSTSGSSGGGILQELDTAVPILNLQNFQSSRSYNSVSPVPNMRRCPVLVRAAAVVQCSSSNPPSPAPQRFIDTTMPDGSTQRRCSVASSVQVHVRIEQVYEIAGMPKLAPIDTVIDSKNASAISIDRIIAEKYGNQCGPGQHLQGDVCVF